MKDQHADPKELEQPNAETRDAMSQLETGHGRRAASVEELMDELAG